MRFGRRGCGDRLTLWQQVVVQRRTPGRGTREEFLAKLLVAWAIKRNPAMRSGVGMMSA